MIIPERRKQELLNYKDSMFVNSFREQSWKYLMFEDIRKLAASRNISIDDIKALSKSL
jgi:hypothetical protein